MILKRVEGQLQLIPTTSIVKFEQKHSSKNKMQILDAQIQEKFIVLKEKKV